MSVATIRIRVAIEEVGELRATLAAFHRVSVTVLRQSTHVPNTSKKRHFGWILAVMLVVSSEQYFDAASCNERERFMFKLQRR